MERSEKEGKGNRRWQEMDKAEKPGSGQYSEGDTETDRQKPERRPRGRNESKRVFSWSRGRREGGDLGDHSAGYGGGKHRLPHPHTPTAKLPSPQAPAYHCPDTVHLQPSSWPGQRRGSYCTLCPGGREMKRVYAQAHTLWWSFIWELGRPSLKEEMTWHVLI